MLGNPTKPPEGRLRRAWGDIVSMWDLLAAFWEPPYVPASSGQAALYLLKLSAGWAVIGLAEHCYRVLFRPHADLVQARHWALLVSAVAFICGCVGARVARTRGCQSVTPLVYSGAWLTVFGIGTMFMPLKGVFYLLHITVAASFATLLVSEPLRFWRDPSVLRTLQVSLFIWTGYVLTMLALLQ